MLSLVGHPNVVNPDAELREHAKEHDWPITTSGPAARRR